MMRPITDHERREGQVFDPEPDFVDVHVQLDWLIRVNGTTDPEEGERIARDYTAEQDLAGSLRLLAHDGGTVCDGDPEDEEPELTATIEASDSIESRGGGGAVSDNRYGTGLALRIREWDDDVEEGERDYDEARKPFDGGVMLAIATLFEAWEADEEARIRAGETLTKAMAGLRETVEQVTE